MEESSHGRSGAVEPHDNATPPGSSLFPGIWEAGAVLGSAAVLAHQGGWDEALMVVVPVGLFGGLFWVASRRAARGQEEASSGGPEDHA